MKKNNGVIKIIIGVKRAGLGGGDFNRGNCGPSRELGGHSSRSACDENKNRTVLLGKQTAFGGRGWESTPERFRESVYCYCNEVVCVVPDVALSGVSCCALFRAFPRSLPPPRTLTRSPVVVA